MVGLVVVDAVFDVELVVAVTSCSSNGVVAVALKIKLGANYKNDPMNTNLCLNYQGTVKSLLPPSFL